MQSASLLPGLRRILIRIAPDGFRELAAVAVVLGVAAAAGVWLGWWPVAPVCAVLWILTAAFFRDPDRTVPDEPGVFVSPADGRVTHVERSPDRGLRISIFLSLFNVHINRAPCDGRVKGLSHKPGRFVNAMRADAAQLNESNTMTLEDVPGVDGPVVVKQIAGYVARRIVCRAAAGDRLTRGQRFGLIKFGSRTELWLPDQPNLSAAVRPGDVVRGGETILARLEAAETRE